MYTLPGALSRTFHLVQSVLSLFSSVVIFSTYFVIYFDNIDRSVLSLFLSFSNFQYSIYNFGALSLLLGCLSSCLLFFGDVARLWHLTLFTYFKVDIALESIMAGNCYIPIFNDVPFIMLKNITAYRYTVYRCTSCVLLQRRKHLVSL